MELPTGGLRSSERFFIGFGLLFGLTLVFVTPPFQAADEPAHFLRAWQISQGQLLATDYGGVLPAGLGRCIAPFEQIRFHPKVKTSWTEIHGAMQIRINPSEKTFYPFPNTAIYSPVPYAGSSVFIAIGRLFCDRPLLLMYAGRIGNLAVYLWLGFLTLRQLPLLKSAALVILLSPVPMFLAASLSADAVTISLVFLISAQILKSGVVPLDNASIVRGWLAFELIAVQLCKWAYAPIVLLLFVHRPPSPARRRGYFGSILLIILICMAVLIGWSHLCDAAHDHLNGGDPTAQLHWITTHPVMYLDLAGNTLRQHAFSFTINSMGAMGWQDALMPTWLVGIHLLVILWIVQSEKASNRIDLRLRTLAALVIGMSVALLVTLEYMGWNQVGAFTIQGLQGRYFLPLSLLFCVVICGSRLPAIPGRCVAGWLATFGSAAIVILIRRYYVR